LDGENLGQGRENTRQYLKEHPEVTQQLREKTIKARGLLWPKMRDQESEPAKDTNASEK